MFANKRTIVDKTVVHRTPSGELISKTQSRAVYYGETEVDEEDAMLNDSERSSRPTSAARDHASFSDRSGPSPYTSRRSDRNTSRTQRASPRSRRSATRNPHGQTSEHGRHSRRHDDRSTSTEYVDPHRLGDSTVYGEEWSTSTGTVFKQSRLMRGDSAPSVCGAVARLDHDNAVLSLIVERINQKRQVNGVPPFKLDESLRNSAREWASHLVLCNGFKVRDDSTMNVWMGRTPGVGVADEWDADMRRWPVHIFECPELANIGIARAYDDRRHSFIIVAEYS